MRCAIVQVVGDWEIVELANDGITLFYTPVIAWGIDEDWEQGVVPDVPFFGAYPITVEMLPDVYALRSPGGRFIFPDDCSFSSDNEAKIIEHFRTLDEQRRHRLAQRKVRPM